jgi:hypothetical protein
MGYFEHRLPRCIASKQDQDRILITQGHVQSSSRFKVGRINALRIRVNKIRGIRTDREIPRLSLTTKKEP